MKTRITILAILFVLFNVIPSDAFDGQERTKQRHNPFPGMNQQKEQYPPGIKDMNDLEDGAARFMKKGDAVQNNPDYIVESVKVYSFEYGKRKYTYTYNTTRKIKSELSEKWKNEEWVNSWRDTYTYDADGNRLTYLYGNCCW